MTALLVSLERVGLVASRRDVICWKVESSGAFSSKYFHRFRIDNTDPVLNPTNFIWKLMFHLSQGFRLVGGEWKVNNASVAFVLLCVSCVT